MLRLTSKFIAFFFHPLFYISLKKSPAGLPDLNGKIKPFAYMTPIIAALPSLSVDAQSFWNTGDKP